MATNIELNYYDGSQYQVLYPAIDLTNNNGTALNASQVSGTLSTSQIPNLSASKITSGILPVERGGTGYSNLSSLKTALGVGSFTIVTGSYTGTGSTSSVKINQSSLYVVIVGGSWYNSSINTTYDMGAISIIGGDTINSNYDKQYLSINILSTYFEIYSSSFNAGNYNGGKYKWLGIKV